MDEQEKRPVETEAEETGESPESERDAKPETQEARPGPQNAKEQFYDKIPLTYRQVDILVKVLIGVLVVALVVGILTGSRLGG